MRRVILLLTVMAATLIVASGVALALTKLDTNGPDTLMGTNGPDELFGSGGSDWFDGRAGKGVVSGGPGSDDPLSPAIGILDGGPGADVISGGPGDDMLIDGTWPGDSAVDTHDGGEGNDFFITANRPAARDIVSCGAGSDAADVDRKDIVGDDCERMWID
jgi:hypothetical protein